MTSAPPSSLGARERLVRRDDGRWSEKGLAPILSWKKRRFGCYRGPRGGQKVHWSARFPGADESRIRLAGHVPRLAEHAS